MGAVDVQNTSAVQDGTMSIKDLNIKQVDTLLNATFLSTQQDNGTVQGLQGI